MAAAGAGYIDISSRPRELQDPLNLFVYHPLSARLARLLRPTGISPNMVSVGGAIALLFATWAFLALPGPLNALAGLGFMLAWHVLDGADGDLARLTGTSSATGELVDGVCDYFGNTVMYFAFAFWLDDTLGGWAWALAAGAGASHILQTNHAETQRRLYAWRVYGRSWLRNAVESGDDVVGKTTWFSRYFGFWAQGYVWLSDRMSPSANPVDKALVAADPDKATRIRALIRTHSGTSLGFEKALGANPKTFLIAASIALGGPVYYFLTMLSAMNLILIVSIVHHKWMERRFAAMISAL